VKVEVQLLQLQVKARVLLNHMHPYHHSSHRVTDRDHSHRDRSSDYSSSSMQPYPSSYQDYLYKEYLTPHQYKAPPLPHGYPLPYYGVPPPTYQPQYTSVRPANTYYATPQSWNHSSVDHYSSLQEQYRRSLCDDKQRWHHSPHREAVPVSHSSGLSPATGVSTTGEAPGHQSVWTSQPPSLPFNELFTELPPLINTIYKAAGILPYSFTEDGKICLLLGCEDRAKKKKTGNPITWWSFGGKREKDETPVVTAAREFNEETAHIFEDQLDTIKQNMESTKILKFWFRPGKYILYFVEVPYDTTISKKFASADVEAREQSDQTKVDWVMLDSLICAIVNRSDSFTYQETIQYFFPFFLQMMTNGSIMKHFIMLENKRAELKKQS